MNKNLKLIVKIVCAIVFLVNMVIFVGLFLFKESPKVTELDLQHPISLMILSTHQDDGVISAGGLAIKNSNLFGRTSVLYLTRPIDDEYAKIRRAEAKSAWSLLPGEKAQLFFMDFPSQQSWVKENVSAAAQQLEKHINEIGPSHVVIPAKENGHYEHDLYGTIASGILKKFPRVEILKASEYNPIYIIEKTPEKVFWFLLRLMPYLPYKDINVGVDPENQLKVKLTRDELELKKQMLLAFVSQAKTIPLAQFGYTDLFDDTNVDELNLVYFVGKYFSVWSLMMLFAFVLLFFLLGLCISFSEHQKSVLVFTGISTFALVGSLLFSITLFKEDCMIYAVFTVGLWFGLLCEFLRKKAG